ncbi:ATP-binding protein [Anabaena azotica]|uniref:ATP-binding protein n=1 Tax=Anabaena azotica TaxID=197653 RepID=UPI0039A702AA
MVNTINIPRYPPEFQQIITAKNYNFVGREFVFAAINNFLHQYDRGYFTIIGEPGIGKSAIIAHYVSQNPGIVYYNVEIADPPQPPLQRGEYEEFLTKICTQLIEIAQNQGSKNITAHLIDYTTENSGFLSLLLQQISDQLNPEQRLIITIDGCDRIDINNQQRGSNLFYLPRYLPEKVYFILTRRPFLPEKSGLLIETPSQSLDLSNYSEQNRADIQEYIKSYLSSQDINYKLQQINQHENNFMYVSEILTAINNNIYPEKLQIYYQSHLDKMNLTTSNQSTLALQVLKILVKDSLISVETIAERLDEDEYDIKVILDKWREFLRLKSREKEINYSLYHLHFCHWLMDKIEYG